MRVFSVHFLALTLVALGPGVVPAIAGPTPQSADGVPSPELLEFLGSWMTDDGEWIDPLAMETIRENEDDADRETPSRNPAGNDQSKAQAKAQSKDEDNHGTQGNNDD